MRLLERIELWKSIIFRKQAKKDPRFIKDPRFETDPLELTAMTAEAFQMAIAYIMIRDAHKARSFLFKSYTAVFSKIAGVKNPDYIDINYLLLESWLSEEKDHKPSLSQVRLALHRLISSEIISFCPDEVAEAYRVAELLMGFPSFKHDKKKRKIKTAEPEFYTRLCKRMLEMARLWLWDDPGENPGAVRKLVELALFIIKKAEACEMQHYKICEIDLKYIQDGDMDLLRKTNPAKYKTFRIFEDWRNTKKHFIYLQAEAIYALLNMAYADTPESYVELERLIEEMFALTRSFRGVLFKGLDFFEQVQWAYLGGRYVLSKGSRKPFSLLRHYLLGK